jgi:hypothetical protein
MTGAALAAYRGIVKGMPGTATATGGADGVARQLWHGLGQVLAGPDPAPVGRPRSPQQIRAANASLGVATLALCMVSVASMNARPGRPLELLGRPLPSAGQILLAIAVVAPLPLVARYPLLGWRIGWLELLLAPLVTGYWWGGWPWGPVQVLALLAAFCVAGVRHQRSVPWCMWALTLFPWWLWLGKDLADLNGPVGATLVFTAATIAVDSVSSRLHAQRALDAQAEGAGGNGHRAGHGLAGMRERVALLGGSLSAGPAPGGGFMVSAVLPLSEAA